MEQNGSHSFDFNGILKFKIAILKFRMYRRNNYELQDSGFNAILNLPVGTERYTERCTEEHYSTDQTLKVVKTGVKTWVDTKKVPDESRAELEVIHQHVQKGGTINLLPPASGISAVVYPHNSHKYTARDFMTVPKLDDKRKSCIVEWISFVQLASLFNSTKIPQIGVILNSAMRRNLDDNTYNNQIDYNKLDCDIESGSYGEVTVVADSYTKKSFIKKDVKLEDFKMEEVLSCIELENSKSAGYRNPWPTLIGVQYEHEKKVVHIFSEYLKNAKTLRDIRATWNLKKHDHQKKLFYFPFHLVMGLISALERLHEAGWVHTDLHSGNIMLLPLDDGTLRVMIIDFGELKRKDSCHPKCDVLAIASHFMYFKYGLKDDISFQATFNDVDEKDIKKKELLEFIIEKEDDLSASNLKERIENIYGNPQENLSEYINVLFHPNSPKIWS